LHKGGYLCTDDQARKKKTMERKFKLGDVIIKIKTTFKDTIFKIIGINYRNNSYSVITLEGNTYRIHFLEESNYTHYTSVLKIANFSLCPICNGNLIDKYSEWAGGNINKCKSCGWC
jgi:hypothetical protein